MGKLDNTQFFIVILFSCFIFFISCFVIIITFLKCKEKKIYLLENNNDNDESNIHLETAHNMLINNNTFVSNV